MKCSSGSERQRCSSALTWSKAAPVVAPQYCGTAVRPRCGARRSPPGGAGRPAGRGRCRACRHRWSVAPACAARAPCRARCAAGADRSRSGEPELVQMFRYLWATRERDETAESTPHSNGNHRARGSSTTRGSDRKRGGRRALRAARAPPACRIDQQNSNAFGTGACGVWREGQIAHASRRPRFTAVSSRLVPITGGRKSSRAQPAVLRSRCMAAAREGIRRGCRGGGLPRVQEACHCYAHLRRDFGFGVHAGWRSARPGRDRGTTRGDLALAPATGEAPRREGPVLRPGRLPGASREDVGLLRRSRAPLAPEAFGGRASGLCLAPQAPVSHPGPARAGQGSRHR